MVSVLADSLDKVSLWVMLGGVAVVWIVCASIVSAMKTSSRERSRREIAAYIAEGTMTAEQGERLMKASAPEDDEA